jgi:hypothetical protein
MAAIFGGELGDKGRLPHDAEAVRLARRGDAGEECVHKNGALVAVEGDVVCIHIAGGVAELRDVEPVIAAGRGRAGRQCIFKPPELINGTHPQRLRIGRNGEAHAALKRALEDGEFPIRLQPDEEEFAALIRCESKRRTLLAQP